MKKQLLFALCFLFAIFIGFAPRSFAVTPVEERLEGRIEKITEEKTLTDGGVKRKYQKIDLFVEQGKLKGKRIEVENGKLSVIGTVEYEEADKVSVSVTKDENGRDVYFITDYVRRGSLYWLFGIFILITVIIGGKRGIASIFGMAISFLVIFLFVLPQILKGQDPILVAILSSLFIIPVNFFLSHGVNKKTTVAVIGTIISLALTGVLANFFVSAAHLTGFTTDEASFLQAAKQGAVQMKGLLLAGIIIGALGVLDDITISQAAIVFKLKDTSEKLSIWKIFSKAMDIGQDHIASMVNTLVLVYTGAALPLLLLFINNPHPFAEVINYEIIAEEIVRTLVVSIGLIAAVPVVTFLAAVAADAEVKRAAKEILHSLK